MLIKSNKCVFLDRDGTIIEDGEYAVDISKMVLKPDAVNSLKRLQNEGYLLIIITNQSGVARGYFTEKDVQKFNNYLVNVLKDNGVEIAKVYYCPHLKGADNKAYDVDCDCRKPKLGMFLRAVNDYDIDLTKSYAIGDKVRDLAICGENGCRGFLLSNTGSDSEYIKVVSSLTTCADIITGVKV
ncbi:MAG: HAD family hydrolase [Clostridia bacterium]|nr:HAD family hydrolase [Clostridia bacterium]